MKVNNKLDKSFGPVGSIAGMIVFIFGLASIYFSWYSLILVLIGAFVGFTNSSTEIDFDKKRVRFLNNLFGVIKTGKWLTIKPDMKIGISRSKKTWRSFSRGNRELEIETEDYRLFLSNSSGRKLIPLFKANNENAAIDELHKMCNQLEIGRYS